MFCLFYFVDKNAYEQNVRSINKKMLACSAKMADRLNLGINVKGKYPFYFIVHFVCANWSLRDERAEKELAHLIIYS